MKWCLLVFAIVLEVIGTTMMKLSEGFTKPLFSVGIFISYAGSLLFLTLSLKKFEISVVYAVWSGVGIAILSIIGIIYFQEKWSLLKLVSLIFIILGVIGLNLTNQQ